MQESMTGLSLAEVSFSREKYGTNALIKEASRGFFGRFFENLSDPIIRILLIALTIEIVFTFGNCNFFEIGGIVAAILISTTVSTLSEYRSEKAFEKMNADADETLVYVIREGKIAKISICDVVVGDIVYLSSGEKICADGTLISGKISVDQSSLNGESVECRKEAGQSYSWELSSKSRVFRGTVITSGSGVMRVERVGNSTYYGMVAKDVQTETRESPLKLRLSKLATQISRIGYVVAIIVGACYLFSAFVVDNSFSPEEISKYFKNYTSVFETLLHALTLMITVVVVAAPEGLPMMITVVLSANMKRMLNDKILVKKLVGIETAGSMNILFTDKTGTLTVGRPECDLIITTNSTYKNIRGLSESKKLFEYLSISAKYNTDIVKQGDTLTSGNTTDKAIFTFFQSGKSPDITVKEKTPFTSDKKYSSVTLDDGRVFIKGAAEVILKTAKYAISDNGDKIPFNYNEIYSKYHEAASSGQRVICVAMKESERADTVFLALIVMKDRLRRGVTSAVRDVLRAGIQLVMITGDSKETATAIACECGLMSRDGSHIALTSAELAQMKDNEVKEILPSLRVIARALPQDKARLVRLSQELELVVGMTGDGINDAPALKLCDVGFSMGSGTDIAKSASDIVILDDSFLAISKTVLYGRTIFKSIRKFITFQLIMNLAACGVSLLGQFIGIDTPITIIQMLWVNIIMDTLGGLAFAGEPALEYYMNEKPKRREEPILSREMLKHIFIQGAYSLALCIFFLTSYVFKDIYKFYSSPDAFYTAFYALFIFLGIFNCFGARSERMWIFSNITKNKLFIAIMLAISVIQIFMIYYGGEVFRCVPLSTKELGFVLGLALTVIPFDMVRRIIEKLK